MYLSNQTLSVDAALAQVKALRPLPWTTGWRNYAHGKDVVATSNASDRTGKAPRNQTNPASFYTTTKHTQFFSNLFDFKLDLCLPVEHVLRVALLGVGRHNKAC